MTGPAPIAAPTAAQPASLAELLALRCGASGRYTAVAEDGSTRDLPYAALADAAAGTAADLRRRGLPTARRGRPGVVLCLADPLEFILGFFAVALGGGVPVPGPALPLAHPAHGARLAGIVRASAPGAVLTSPADAAGVAALLGAQRVRVLAFEPGARSADGAGPPVPPHPVCYEQYTSGSVADPRPIRIGTGHAFAQLRQAAAAFGEDRTSVSVNWVPLYHDMGLVTSVLRPLWSDYHSVILDPFAFVRRPESWPEALSRFGATHTSAPDFGYALCAAKTPDPSCYDLAPLRVARSAGEQVRPATLAAFTAAFAPAGFRAEAFNPSYGLAEATLTVTATPLGRGPRVVSFDREALRAGRARPAPAPGPETVELVSSGVPLPGTVLTITAAEGAPADGTASAIGEVCVAGPQVAAGTGPGPLATGDSGFLHGGELYLLGRSRERFQIRGQNYYGNEVEAVATGADPGLRPGRAAAFTVPDGDGSSSGDGSERLVVLAESRLAAPELTGPVAQAAERRVRTALSRQLGLSAHRVGILPRGTLPVTTSGKIRREACRALLPPPEPGPAADAGP